MSGDSGRAVRLADPVYAPATLNGQHASLGDSPAQQRNPGERTPIENFETTAFSPGRPRAAQADVVPTERRATPLRPNLKLYTFA